MSNELRHYGVLGMKWGKRKARNTHNDYKNAHNKKHVSEMSDQELRNRNNRLQMEQQYKQLTKKTNHGKKVVNSLIAAAGTIASAERAYSTYKKYGKAAVNKLSDMVVKGINLSGPLTID